MSIFKQERPVASRAELEAYLEQGHGQIGAKIVTPGIYIEQISDDVSLESDVAEVEPGYYVRHRAENGENITMFVPQGWQPGNSVPPEEPPYFLGPEDQLPLSGLKVVVLSRHAIPAPANAGDVPS